MIEIGDTRTDESGQMWEAISVDSGDNHTRVEWQPVDS